MRKRTKVIAGIILAIIGLIVLNSTKKKPAVYTSAKAERGEVMRIVSATGEVEPASRADLKFVNSGKIKEINVKVGESVKTGAVLARLETAALDAQLLQAQATLAAAEANYRTLLEGSTPEQVKLAETGVENARIALNSAKQSLDDTNASSQKEIANAEFSLESARVALDNASNNLANVKTSNDNGLKNAYEAAWDSANSSLSSCDDALDANKTALENEDAKDTLSATNPQYLASANSSKAIAKNYYDSAVALRDNVSSRRQNSDIDSVLTKTQDALEKTRTALSDTNSVLQATITSIELTQAELDALKTSISTSKTAIGNAIVGITAKKQAISSQIVSNQTALTTAQSSVNSAQSALKVAESSLANVKSAAVAKINAAQNAVYSREGDLKQAQDSLSQVKAGPTSSKVSAQQAIIEQSKASVDLIQSQINESSILAPQDGIITDVNGEIGEIAPVADPFVSMIIANGFQIKANIAEVDIAKLKAGEDVEISFDALDSLGTEKKFEGKISQIDPAQTVISGVVYYKVTTLFTDGNGTIKPGMTANLDIMTAKKENVVKIPFQALKEKDGKKYVQVVSGKDKFDDIDVQVGLKGDSDYEVISGLSEGQEVVTFMGK